MFGVVLDMGIQACQVNVDLHANKCRLANCCL